MTPQKSSPNSTATSAARTPPSAPSPSPCATAGAASRVDEKLRGEITPKNILMIGPDRRRQDRDRPPPGQAGWCALHQGGGDEVHRGRLRRQGCRLDHPRPGGHGDQAGARGADAHAAHPRRRRGRRSACSTSSSPAATLKMQPARPCASACAKARWTTRTSRSSCSKPSPRWRSSGPWVVRHGGHGRAAEGHVRQPRRQQAQGPQAEDRRGNEAAGRGRSRQAAQRGRDQGPPRCRPRRRWASSSSTRSTRSPAAPEHGGADVSRQGVQRDLLPLVEGTTVNTKFGMVKTDHILFIASGAFHLSKPSGPDPRAARPLPDPRGAGVPVGRRFRGHPQQHAREPGQAIPGPAGDRGRDADTPARGHPPPRRNRLRGQRTHREHRRAAPCPP